MYLFSPGMLLTEAVRARSRAELIEIYIRRDELPPVMLTQVHERPKEGAEGV